MARRFLITGATGFVGGHLSEACIQRGESVVAIARPTSDTSLLEKWGVTIHRGELGDPVLVRKAMEDVDVVVHTAAKVGDWGPIEDYRPVNVDALRVLLEESKNRKLHRFVHLSSLGVYEARHHYGTDESTPPATWHRDAYSMTKVEAEKLALQYHRDFGVPVVAPRPGFIYGPRDRIVLPRIIENLRAGRVQYPGGGQGLVNTIFVQNLVDAIFLMIDNPVAVGQAYNLTDDEKITKRRFIEAIADALGLPRPTKRPPLWLAWSAAWIIDKGSRLVGRKSTPFINFTRLKFLGLNLDFSIEKAKRELGYKPRFTFDQAMKETTEWYQTHV